jgi:hypothetical protein
MSAETVDSATKTGPDSGKESLPSLPKPASEAALTSEERAAISAEKKRKFKATALKIWNVAKWILLVVLVFALLAGLSLYKARQSKRLTPFQYERIKSLIQYASKSAHEAERIASDEPIQALLHADYAVTYFSAARHIVDKATIESLIGANADELESYLKSLQQRLVAQIYGLVDANAGIEPEKQ